MNDPASRGGDAPASLCPSCGATSTTPYCGQCGQRQTYSMSVRAWLGSVVEGLSSADGRLWSTANTLLRWPGRIELDWAAGRRKPFMSPTSIYMFAAALLFFVTAVIPTPGNVFADFAHGALLGGGDFARDGGEGQAPEAVVEQVKSTASTATKWILMLGMVPALAGLTRAFLGRGGDHYACHLVASLHLHAVMFMSLTLVLILLHLVGISRDPDLSSAVAMATVLPLFSVYFAFQSRRIYGRGWLSVLLRNGLVVVSYYLVFVVVGGLLVLLAGRDSMLG